MSEQQVAAETPQANKTSSLVGRLKILVLVLGIVVVEGIVVYLLLPSPADTKVLAMALEAPAESAKGHAHDVHELPLEEMGHGEHLAEVELGNFQVTVARLEKNVTRNVSFRLWGGVPTAEKEEMAHHFEKVKHRVHDDIDTIIRAADEASLSDPGLSLIKRRILDNTNRNLGKPYLKSVYLNEYTFVEL